MASLREELIGEVRVEDTQWRITLSHGFICLWTDKADAGAISPRYVLSADIPPKVLQLASEAARRHGAGRQV